MEAHTQQQPQGSAVLGVAGQWAETAAEMARNMAESTESDEDRWSCFLIVDCCERVN
jgi:hypothetical protein